MSSSKKLLVKDFLRKMIDAQVAAGRTQRQLAVEMGYKPEQANFISMLKQGVTRLPISKIAITAHVLRVDPLFLARLVLSEYSPETLEMVETVVATGTLVSRKEAEILEIIRRSTGGADVAPESTEEIEALAKMAAGWKQ